MNLIPLNINATLLLENHNFLTQENNIDYLNEQAINEQNLEQKLKLLSLAANKIERFHSYFHFEQSYFHLQLAKLYRQQNDEENAVMQLNAAIFQDHLNKEAEQLLSNAKGSEIYKRPFADFTKYLFFATNEEIANSKDPSFWSMNDASFTDLRNIIAKIRAHHLKYHQESAKLYLNRALIFHKLNQFDLAKNDLVKAKNLDSKVEQNDYYSMIILQMSTKIVLGLGSNLGDRENYLKQATEKLQELGILQNITCSSILSSKADLKPNSPKDWNLDYLNMAVMGYTILSPTQLLKKIKDIEQIIGRKASPTWSPREIDIDILAYGDQIIEQDDLIIPHPSLLDRQWAIIPFAEIYPDWQHPILGKIISEIKHEKN